MDELTTRFRSAYDRLMDHQPDPPSFESIAEPTLEARPSVGRSRGKPLLAFAGGIAAVAILGLVLWIGGAWSERLPPPLDEAAVSELEWKPTAGIDLDFDQIQFATGPNGSLAVTYSVTPEGATVAGVYQSVDGVHWTGVEGEGLAAEQLTWLTTGRDGFVASGLHRDSGESRPTLWTTLDGSEWDRTPLPLPEQDPGAIVNSGVGPVVFSPDSGFALGQFVVNRPAEGGSPQFDDQGNPLPAELGTFLWETDGSGDWIVAQSAPIDPLWLADGPAGPVALSAEEDGTGVWRFDDGSWRRTATIADRAELFEVVVFGNQDGYIVVFQDGRIWSSPDAVDWTSLDDPTFPGFDGPGFIASGPGGFVASSTASLAMEWSADGTEWTEVANAEILDVESLNAFMAANVAERALTIVVSRGSGERIVLTGTAGG